MNAGNSGSFWKYAGMAWRAQLAKGILNYCYPVTVEQGPDLLITALQLPQVAP